MKSALSMTVLAGSSTGIMAVTTQCSAGFVHKDNLSGLMCMTNVNNAASCNSECCKTDENTCGGIDNKEAIVCPFDHYKGDDDAWAKTPATKDNAVKVCCAPRATCAQAVCSAGYKANTAKASMVCSGDAKSCAKTTGCCEANPQTCGGHLAKNAGAKCTTAGKIMAVTGGSFQDDAWKSSPLPVAGDFDKKCCKASAAICKAIKVPNGCEAGYHVVLADIKRQCKDKKGIASTSTEDCKNKQSPCCTKDQSQCGGTLFKCPAGKYVPTSVKALKVGVANGNIKQLEYNTKCCTAAVSTCKDATCPAGYTKKAGVDAVQCAGDAKSCLKTVTTCCQPDTKTCGGQTAINCPYGFFNEQTMWTKDTADSVKDAWKGRPANATNKNTNCCTARAICDTTATTTPAVTATPAAPALKYSANQKVGQHQTTDASASNLLWLGCGAILGMSILSIVQKVRASSVREGNFRSSEDDAENLLASCEE